MSTHPLLYEINAGVWLGELSRARGAPLTLADVPDSELERLAGLGVELLWLMGVWHRGEAGRTVALDQPWLHEARRGLLPAGGDDDIWGSPYAVAGYRVASELGGPTALAALRERLAAMGIGLVLDFVPNHTGLDHPWVREFPERYVQGGAHDLVRSPDDFFRVQTAVGDRVIAHGRDPFFPPWTDTAQLNHFEPATRSALLEVLHGIASQCDGVRCDMAMLPLQQVFARTWKERVPANPPALGEPWVELIPAVRARRPGFLFIAEAYWDTEGALQAQGFDFTYDKRLCDYLRSGDTDGLRTHLGASPEFQQRSARFLENHDEERAAVAFPGLGHRASALVAFTLPGMLLLHEGQNEGRRVRIPVQLRRRPTEEPDPALATYYEHLLAAIREPAFREGGWGMLEVREAWPGNSTVHGFFAWEWSLPGETRRWVVVNLGPTRGQCFVDVPAGEVAGGSVLLVDRLSDASYRRNRDDLARRGLYLDLESQEGHLFEVVPEP